MPIDATLFQQNFAFPGIVRRVLLSILLVYPVLCLVLLINRWRIESDYLNHEIYNWMAEDSQLLAGYTEPLQARAFMLSASRRYHSFEQEHAHLIQLWDRQNQRLVFDSVQEDSEYAAPPGRAIIGHATEKSVMQRDGIGYTITQTRWPALVFAFGLAQAILIDHYRQRCNEFIATSEHSQFFTVHHDLDLVRKLARFVPFA